MGGHADTCKVVLFQEIDIVGRGHDMGQFERSGLFAPSPLKLREPPNKWGEASCMVFIVEPCPMPSPKRRFHRKVKEAGARAGLKTHTSNKLSVSGTQLIF
jgi:hypothetical protein